MPHGPSGNLSHARSYQHCSVPQRGLWEGLRLSTCLDSVWTPACALASAGVPPRVSLLLVPLPLSLLLFLTVVKNIQYKICHRSHFCFKDFIYLFLERGKGKGRERNINVWLSLVCPPLDTWPATQACALNWESNQQPFGLQLVLSPLSYTSQGAL